MFKTDNKIIFMNQYPNRRRFLAAIAASIISVGCTASPARENANSLAKIRLETLEKDLDGRLGVFALNTANGHQLNYRADERFPVCSTFKVLVAAAILTKSVQETALLEQFVKYERHELVNYSPITEQHIGAGMAVADLCAAALQYSDNTAANLLMNILGGPEAVTAFARLIGDKTFRLDRWETALNTATPDDLRDTSTPMAMGLSLYQLLLSDVLSPIHREQLKAWMFGNTTGATRIKAGIPTDWKIADKTGSGDYGTANDIAVVWPAQGKPVVISIYSTQHKQDAKARSEIIAMAARIVADWVS